MRFDSPQYIDNWKAGLGFPAIHNEMFNAIMQCKHGISALDLCCNSGLFTERMKHQFAHVFGIDGDAAAIQLGVDAGIANIEHFVVNSSTIDTLLCIIQDHKVDTIIARRCFPELFGSDIELGRYFIKGIHSINVKYLFIEGRVASNRSVNQLSSLDKEIGLADSHYTKRVQIKNIAYLRGLDEGI
jgi:hypothetical protein